MNTIEFIRSAIAESRNAEALDVARNAISTQAHEPDSELLYLAGLACARMGAVGQAHEWYTRIDSSGVRDEQLLGDILCLAGRISKERFEMWRASDQDRALRHAVDSFVHYRRAYEAHGTSYAAINTAAMAFVAGESAVSRQFAQLAIDACSAAVDHWAYATRGEAYVLLGNAASARAEYQTAYQLACNQHGVIASMRRQLRLLSSPLAIECLSDVPAPVVIAFSGHMIDQPGRRNPRFTESMVDEVADRIRAHIQGYRQAIGFSQAACGADILFLEAMQQAGMQTNVFLPFASVDYLSTSVAFAGVDWTRRHHQALRAATRVTLITEERYLGDDILFEHVADVIQGMAFLRASELATTPRMLTVEARGSNLMIGGTASTSSRWSEQGWISERIELNSSLSVVGGAETDSVPRLHGLSQRRIQSFVFADVTGFSKMPEEYTPKFVDSFLTTVRRIIDELKQPPADANTRGDGLYLVFDTADSAAEFATSLLAAIRTIDWMALELPPDTTVRIGLHTGPAYRTYDPVMKKHTFYGSHVNRTARLEAIVQPGQIFATEAFAASMAAKGEGNFRCEYIGETKLAKNFGVAPLYRLYRRT